MCIYACICVDICVYVYGYCLKNTYLTKFKKTFPLTLLEVYSSTSQSYINIEPGIDLCMCVIDIKYHFFNI